MTPEGIYKKYIDCPNLEWATWELKGNFLEDVVAYSEQEQKQLTDQFLSYLDKQIDICTTWDNAVKPHETSIEADQFRIRARTLKQVKEKYLHYLTIK